MIQHREVSYSAADKTCKSQLFWDDARTGPQAGVVIFPEFWGLNDYSRRRARMLAEQGYVVLAADVYGDAAQGSTAQEASAMMTALTKDPSVAGARIKAAVEALAAQPEVDGTRLATMGYCMGGALALGSARLGLPLRAVVSFHGVLDTARRAKPGEVHAKILVCTGGADPIVPAASVAAFHDEMTAAGVDFEVVSYPGVLHSFTNPLADERGRTFGLPLAYNAAADRASWASLLTLLSKTLDG